MNWDTGGQEHTQTFAQGSPEAQQNQQFVRAAERLYLNGVFLGGVFIPTSPFHPADGACLAPDDINGPSQLPGTKHRHPFTPRGTRRSNSPCCQHVSFMFSFPPGKCLSNWDEKSRRSLFAFLYNFCSLNTQKCDPKNHHKQV